MRVEVKGVGTCQFTLRGGKTLTLQDVLYVPDIRRNLISVSSLLKSGFNLNFHERVVDILNNSVYYG